MIKFGVQYMSLYDKNNQWTVDIAYTDIICYTKFGPVVSFITIGNRDPGYHYVTDSVSHAVEIYRNVQVVLRQYYWIEFRQIHALDGDHNNIVPSTHNVQK